MAIADPVTEEIVEEARPYFYTRDHLGSVREMTDSTQAVVAEYAYDAWGNTTKVSGSMDASFGYAGMQYFPAVGLYGPMGRFYDPQAGRWLSRDPLPNAEISQGPNLYQYVFNNPAAWVDSSGLLGYGIVGGGEFAAGLGPQAGPLFGGKTAVGSAGVGLFFGPNPNGTLASFGGYVSGGSSTPCDVNAGLGGGVGVGMFLTNADNASDLEKTTNTINFNLVVLSISYSYGNGIGIAEFSAGRVGLSYSNLSTTTHGGTARYASSYQ